jgi:acyl carrier protein
MSNTPDSAAGWVDFAAELARIGAVPGAAIEPKARLVVDLGFDSLTLAEVIVFVINKYNPVAFSQELEDRTWEDMTVEALFNECVKPR